MFASYYLIRNGFSVTIVDKNPSGGETSVYNAGLIVPSFAPTPTIGMSKILAAYIGRQGPVYISPRQILMNAKWLMAALKHGVHGSEKAVIELGMKSLELYKDFFAEESVGVDLAKGIIGLYKDADHARKAAQELNGQFIDEKEAQRLGFTRFGGGVLFEGELSVDPAKLFKELRRRLSEMGARMILGGEAQLNSSRPKISSAIVNGENLTGDFFVVAAGAWSRNLCGPLGYDPHVIPARGLAMIFDTGGAKLVGYPALFEDYGIAVVQNGPSALTVTSFFELRGFQSTFSESRKRWLLKILSSHLKDYNQLRYINEGVGYRPCTPDQLPVIGKVPGYENLIIASGHCRLGITLAPATGHMIGSMLAGQMPPEGLLRPFDPSRFAA